MVIHYSKRSVVCSKMDDTVVQTRIQHHMITTCLMVYTIYVKLRGIIHVLNGFSFINHPAIGVALFKESSLNG